jgi:hypothetical protein
MPNNPIPMIKLRTIIRLYEGLRMLDTLELYAAASYDRTQQHLIAAAGLATVAECEAYDYTAGYPEKITFDINH